MTNSALYGPSQNFADTPENSLFVVQGFNVSQQQAPRPVQQTAGTPPGWSARGSRRLSSSSRCGAAAVSDRTQSTASMKVCKNCVFFNRVLDV